MTDLRRLRVTTDMIMVLAMAGAIFFALIGVIIHHRDTRSAVEKRALAARPNLTAVSWFSNAYQPAMEKYLSDRFGGRTTLVRWNAQLHVATLHTSPSRIVTVGRGGWLLYSGEQALEPYQPDKPVPSGAEDWVTRAIAMRETLRQQNIPFVIVIAPNPPSVATETLPAGYRAHPQTNLDVFMAAAAGHGLTIVDPRSALISARASHEVYLSTDSHWNSYGALIASNLLLQTIREKSLSVTPWPKDSYSVAQQTQPAGDLAAALGIGGVTTATSVVLNRLPATYLTTTPDYGLKLQQAPQAYVQSGTTRPRAVIFRDSYANAMMPYLNDSFSRVVYVRSRLVVPAIVAAEHPDVVIMELAERYLPDIGTPSTQESENGITK